MNYKNFFRIKGRAITDFYKGNSIGSLYLMDIETINYYTNKPMEITIGVNINKTSRIDVSKAYKGEIVMANGYLTISTNKSKNCVFNYLAARRIRVCQSDETESLTNEQNDEGDEDGEEY